MLYLLDANVLIDSNRDYYPIERVPEFWEWLAYVGEQGFVKIPIEVYEEIKVGHDSLATWVKEDSIENALLLKENADVSIVSNVIDNGYAPDLTDIEIEKIGRDPFLVAYGLVSKNDRCVVTTEVSKPSTQRANRRIPDVCTQLGIQSCNTFAFVRTLNFATNWKKVS